MIKLRLGGQVRGERAAVGRTVRAGVGQVADRRMRTNEPVHCRPARAAAPLRRR